MTASEISDTFKNTKIIKEIKKVCKKITIENCTSGYVIDACVLIDCDDEKILCNVLKTMPKRNFYISSEIENEFLKSQKYCKKSGKNVKRSLEDLNNLIKKLQNSGLKIYSIDITNEMKSDSNELFREYNRFHKRIDGRRIFHYPDNIHLNLAHKTKSKLITNDSDFLYFCKLNKFKSIDFQNYACRCGIHLGNLPYNYRLHKSKNRGSRYNGL